MCFVVGTVCAYFLVIQSCWLFALGCCGVVVVRYWWRHGTGGSLDLVRDFWYGPLVVLAFRWVIVFSLLLGVCVRY